MTEDFWIFPAQFLLSLLLAPFLTGIINRVKAIARQTPAAMLS
jgi:hypothetical protein